MIFRNDDVNFNTDKNHLASIYGVIHEIFPNAEIWSGITLFAGRNNRKSVYGDLPLKTKETNWFYKNADSFMYDYRHPMYKVASHGLYHVDHSKISKDAQEMSILGSCSYLDSKIFIPPFNKFNQDTVDVCFDNDIKFDPHGWRSLEHATFDASHKKWYFHSWRFTADKLRDLLIGNVFSNNNS
jgi:hypothetical protein